jgi:NAD(P)-dependent dehydrogenase (short-subunit alcohol dehydrogenase family)
MTKDVALIVGGGPGISASCARLFAKSGMHVGIAARNPDKAVLQNLEKMHGVRRYACDASEPAAVELLFQNVVRDLGAPTLVVHNIDGRVAGIFRKGIAEADPGMALETLRGSAFSAFLVGQQAARLMRENEPSANGAKGTIIFTNASAALKGFPMSGAFAMACQAKSGLAQSMARELMPQGIHIATYRSSRDRLEAGRRYPRAQTRGGGRRRQHGRPGLHRGNLSAAASPASVHVGVRSRATTVGREMVTGARSRPLS